MEDAVAVTLEAGPPLVGRFGLLPVARAPAGRVAPGGQQRVLELLALAALCGSAHATGAAGTGSRVGAMRACESAWARRTGPE